MWLCSPNLECVHGFSIRSGGISTGPFSSLNLGGSEDETEKINRNRKLALEKLNLSPDNICYLKQVHGSKVCLARKGRQEGDGLVTNEKDLALAVSIADCYPILFYDPEKKVIGAAHAGWRGTLAGIAGAVVKEMRSLGASEKNIKVAIGPGISLDRFEVGPEVLEKFKEAGFPENCFRGNKINLVKSNLFILLQNNIPEHNIWAMNRCTFEDDFFSYRRDKGLTGRMWAVIAMQ